MYSKVDICNPQFLKQKFFSPEFLSQKNNYVPISVERDVAEKKLIFELKASSSGCE